MNKTRLFAAISAALLTGSVLAQTVVTVNGTKIDSSELDARAKFVQQQSQGKVQDTPELRQYIANEVVLETVVTQEAKRLQLDKSSEYKTVEADALKQAREKGLDKQPDFKGNWTRFQNQLLMDVYAQDVAKKNPVSDADVQKRYDDIKSRYHNTDEVQLGEIVTDKEDQAKVAIRELGAKKSFADVAKKYSIDPAVKAGQPALNEYTSLVDLKDGRPKIFEAVQNLKKGEYTRNALKGEGIFVVFYANDKRKITVPAFDQIRDNVRDELQQERVQAAVGKLMQQAKIVPADGK
ncbi:peptidyl-prolyl cis-trans isomerase [Kingella kingae]|uniref:peptidyl-prolyl cis-trans isomerase n=1 Tax=Kingella kingae TaxID=504 RepID=UPI00040EC526|nr:peptidyl-prolyl cis-trans isomerase [Kingella kingae]MBD3613906.1 peptidyl-prolyl cis-trans isomerase [Kingella kingae]MBD3632157.1 peptidyl-prolyl cis-trans isomerase [Kingella kingae]MBD3659537.1 peptidyl-prolyl cis-trans isomerase [Kingella kingae]MDK4587104.1 peptidyl-prolyl cis-trans isomerase [Kingella kingae]MDK4605116.1 peptidyl-prolyl cis-trans isomerase [Kingella kingae]